MLILLPKENNLTALEESIDSYNLTSWNDDLHEIEIDVYIPKFTFETEYKLKNYLEEMGINIAFTFDANFSGMTGREDIYINSVIHKAFIEVNEEGTEAAAATAVVMVGTSIGYTFNADHPFIFLIQHKETGNILFMGKVINPLQ